MRLGVFVVRFRGGFLRLRAPNLFGAAHSLKRFQVLLRRVVLTLRLDQSYFCVVHQLLGERSLPKQRLPIVIKPLRGIKGLPEGFDIGFRFCQVVRHGGPGCVLISGTRPFVQLFAFLRRRQEVAVFENGDELSFPHMIAAPYQETGNRRADFRDDAGLFQRVQDRFGRDKRMHGRALGHSDLHWSGRCPCSRFAAGVFL